MALIAMAACSSGSDDAAAPSATPGTTLDRLMSAHPDRTLDPSREAWAAVLADAGFNTQPVVVVEFVRLNDGPAAREDYDAFVSAVAGAVSGRGAAMVAVNDTLRPGIEGLASYEGGVSWLASFPSLSAYVDVMLDERVTATAPRRRAAVAEAQVLVGPNLLPDVVLQLPPNEPASAFPSGRVSGRTGEEIVEELLTIYPSGGADPTRQTLEWMTAYDGFADQRVHFINLYAFNDDPGGGETALGEYNAAALPFVLAHGARPKVLANVTHHLVGPTAWDRFIFVSWPSLAVFTDLRLEPGYIEAQKSRVVSGEAYGNLITVERRDQP